MDNSNYNAPGVAYAESDPVFRQSLTTVSKNRSLKSELEKYRFEEMANGFNDIETIFLTEEWFDILEDLTEIHSPKPKKEEGVEGEPVVRRTVQYYDSQNKLVTKPYPYFDLSPSIDLFFNRAKNRVVLMKSLEGRAVLNATESRHVHSSTERSYAMTGLQKENPIPFAPKQDNRFFREEEKR